MNDMKLYIHIGYRKTATTWLQEHVFSRHPEIHYLGKTEEDYPEWLLDWHYLDDFVYESRRESLHQKLQELLERDRINMISSEAFTNTGVIYQQALRIRDIAPYARIIMTLRDPVEMTLSHYRHDILTGDAFCSIDHYIDWTDRPFVIGKRRSIYLPDFIFDAINLYSRLFGSENLLVLRYEDMVRDPKLF